ncbi:MAG: double-strand break repair protein AddB [Rhodospirillaceae bacterium TMED167]|nr:double-strand break repair protein AddB [Rhodospirillaceae bacterium]OUW31130.1 MAG: double-strand break repair protein AddB [Rhodospirillaceae bacterium TMED167]
MATGSQASKSVYTIPSGAPFADVLTKGLLDQVAGNPLALTSYTLLLPTRRAVRSIREAFLRMSKGEPILLPNLVPLGDLDEEEILLSGWPDGGLSAAEDLPPAIPGLRRQLLLTQLVHAKEKTAVTIDQSARLAFELSRLLDQVQTEQLSFDGLAGLVPADLAEHWKLTLDFLEILIQKWPNILAEEGYIDPADRRNRLLEAQTRNWQTSPPQGPVIAAGSTGSIPATAKLLNLVAALPDGSVVLPGLDQTLSGAEIGVLEETHPQYGMYHLLERMELSPTDVQVWPSLPEELDRHRAAVINTALRPAVSLSAWRDQKSLPTSVYDQIDYLECPSPEEETGVIALMMREVLETPGKTAALITPDRDLARRVTAQLHRWDIEIDDSAGTPLALSPPVTFLRLCATLVSGGFRPVNLLAFGKHPLAACGYDPAEFRRLMRFLEVSVLRGPLPAPGLEGLRHQVETQGGSDALLSVLDALEKKTARLRDIFAQGNGSLRSTVEAHIRAAEDLAATDYQAGPARLWAGDAGEAAAAFMAEVLDSADVLQVLQIRAYPALLDSLLAGRAVRPRYGKHPRLNIWGLLEARLQNADVMILAGLNEGTWPPEVQGDPWMSRPMRQRFGLPSLERRIGLTAHDFVQAFCAPHVVLTRSRRVAGTPTVPARWLLRLAQFFKAQGQYAALLPSKPWEHWQTLLDKPDGIRPVDPPAPRPPVTARPRRLSVTQVETWMRDPYTIYARHILDLKPLPPLEQKPDATDYGTLIHRILDAFADRYPAELAAELPDDAEAELIELGRQRFQDVLSHPAAWAFWWPRFLRIANWFVARERSDRSEIKRIWSEVSGTLELDGTEGAFLLTAKADRIDLLTDGTLRIIDYKTGAAPSATEVKAGFAPQLPLEALIAGEGGFNDLPAAGVAALDYWRLRGSVPPGEVIRVGKEAAQLAEEAKDGLLALVRLFDRNDTPYEARPRPDKAPRFSDYEHLARVREWAVAGEESGSPDV